MNHSKYQIILYVIVLVIISTIGIQGYWNYKNYQSHRRQLVNDVQTSLDKAVDDYYTQLAEKTTFAFSFVNDTISSADHEHSKISSVLKHFDSTKSLLNFSKDSIKGVKIYTGYSADSIMELAQSDLERKKDSLIQSNIKNNVQYLDIKKLTSKVMISINSDSISLDNLSHLVNKELNRKQLDITYQLSFKPKNQETKKAHVWNPNTLEPPYLETQSKSNFLPKGSQLTIQFSNISSILLKRMVLGILISLTLILGVIACLFYLLKVIRNQKQLAEVKNDLISNMTHEFKTPIATIGVALESLKDFNALNDQKRTESYLNISNQQLTKLHMMVEKLLETATLDSHDLELNLESTNINDLLLQLKQKHQLQTNKTIHFSHPDEHIFALLDAFHFENAINNVLDNAIKYGGDIIKMTLSKENKRVLISISDDGKGISKLHKEHIFDKFYRVPQGNTHDVKGFGIGLFYTKTIIEKHHGSISLDSNTKQTTFTISIPHG
ncbi:sensor histidine kinase [Mangrovimonas futianensis]|uniref:sensor histidine kinase n=1 Tax=Mangrovimonas futianensis TaxID=2895523 RepID=UPI001E3F84DB|nr:HAMP domain-containing sensor histidine kinase [Mangrovimonas futianensis]MCF1421533.1 HAMP domain-containing histidine kinase [Mangrovimonas futianensis]